MAQRILRQPGGIKGLLQFLQEHGEAVNADLLDRGYTVRDIGSRLGWGDLRSLITYARHDSAIYRSLHPKSWWYTPELSRLDRIEYLLAAANWQRGGGKGEKPKPPVPPQDKPAEFKSRQEIEAERARRREHLARRRAEKLREKGA